MLRERFQMSNKMSITLIFDDDSQVRLEGDSERITEIIRPIAVGIKGFIKHDYYMVDRTEPETQWNLDALTKLLNEDAK